MALAFFDLDGTLTRFDTFIPYCLLSLLYRPHRILAMRLLLKTLIHYCKGSVERQELKETFLVAFLGGARRKDIDRLNKVFCRFILPWMIREEMIEKVRLHKRAGDHIYLVSASPDIYVNTLAKRWRLHGAICTKLEWRNGLLTGRILGRNCQGEEKARRIEALFNEGELKGSFAYGNSDGDQHLLELVTFGMSVNRR